MSKKSQCKVLKERKEQAAVGGCDLHRWPDNYRGPMGISQLHRCPRLKLVSIDLYRILTVKIDTFKDSFLLGNSHIQLKYILCI